MTTNLPTGQFCANSPRESLLLQAEQCDMNAYTCVDDRKAQLLRNKARSLRHQAGAAPVAFRIQIGCTAARHQRLGIHAVINARGSQQWRNDVSEEQARIERDARAIRDRVERRVRFYQFNSVFFGQKNLHRVQHLLSSYND